MVGALVFDNAGGGASGIAGLLGAVRGLIVTIGIPSGVYCIIGTIPAFGSPIAISTP